MNLAAKNDLPWRIEQTCFNAWPALKEITCNGWLLRFADGLSRRANSANPLSEEIEAPDGLIGVCEAHYRGHKLPTIFRVPSIIDPSIQDRLEKRGYTKEGESLVLYSGIGGLHVKADADVKISSQPVVDWLAAMSRWQKHSEDNRQTYEKIVRLITVPVAYASVSEQEQVVSLAYGVVHGKLLCVESVITGEPFRGKGYSRRVLAALVDWARSAGAEGVCIQVQVENNPAVALYTKFGLKELYRYHYRREPVAR